MTRAPGAPPVPRRFTPHVFAVVQFPGSNDDRDARFALKSVLGVASELVWHQRAELPADTQAVLLPGGFSFGDYLRCGAMAKYSPIMAAVSRFAQAGGPVLGVCNGFQVLCESGLLPGVLVRNHHLHFVCDFVHVRVESAGARSSLRARARARCCGCRSSTGRAPTARRPSSSPSSRRSGQIVLRYCEPDGRVTRRRESERRRREHRGRAQRARQRDGSDAPPRARRRAGDRRHRRPRAARLARRCRPRPGAAR